MHKRKLDDDLDKKNVLKKKFNYNSSRHFSYLVKKEDLQNTNNRPEYSNSEVY